MPWTPDDAKDHSKSEHLNPHQWATIANSVLKETGDDAKAIRIANAKAKTNG
jgi:uncharacterized protein YdaT